MTPKQQQFVAEYLIDLNATQAAIRAGYSPKTAEDIGRQALRKAPVADAIALALGRRSVRTQVTADRVLEEVGNVAFAKITDVVRWGVKEISVGFDGDGKRLSPQDIGEAVMVHTELAPYVEPIDSDDLPEHVKAAISEVTLTKDGLRIKMHGKTEALNLAGRHLGMWNDKLDVTLRVSMAQRILEAREHERLTRAG